VSREARDNSRSRVAPAALPDTNCKLAKIGTDRKMEVEADYFGKFSGAMYEGEAVMH